MKKQAVCEYCGKVFQERNDEDYYDYKQDCVKHEITHLNLYEDFKINLTCALWELDQKYKSGSNILKIEVSACWGSYYGKDVTYDFEVNSTAINERIVQKIEVPYDNKENIPTKEEIINLLEHHYFIPTIENKYEGIFKFEDWCGGDGANEHMIGDSYISTIYEAFKGKKVRIEVIE